MNYKRKCHWKNMKLSILQYTKLYISLSQSGHYTYWIITKSLYFQSDRIFIWYTMNDLRVTFESAADVFNGHAFRGIKYRQYDKGTMPSRASSRLSIIITVCFSLIRLLRCKKSLRSLFQKGNVEWYRIKHTQIVLISSPTDNCQ